MPVDEIHRRRIEGVADILEPLLKTRGEAAMRVADCPDVDLWRAAARKAARRIGWRVCTGVSRYEPLTVYAVCEQWWDEKTDEERTAHLHAAVDRVGELFADV